MTLAVGLILDSLVLLAMVAGAITLATRPRPRPAGAALLGLCALWHLIRRGLEDLAYEGPYPVVLVMIDNDLLDWLPIVLPALGATFTLAAVVEWVLLVAAVFVGRRREASS